MTGKEKFRLNGQELEYDMTDFWRFQYSNIYSLHGEIAEFIVARALEINEAQNSEYWTLWDITYRGARIEVKATAYYHLWNENGAVSKKRTFAITKANGAYDKGKSGNDDYRRQNHIYIFCLNNGETKESSDPLNLDNWEFYVVPTVFINEHCENNKSISLGRIKSFGFSSIRYDELKDAVDNILDSEVEV